MANRSISYVAVVDDDESMCRSLGRLLHTAGYRALTYTSAEAFLEDIKRPRFDCLMLDVQLGGISGLELCRRLAAVKDPTPVIFISVLDNPEVRQEAELLGCAGFFQKTDPGDLVIESIERAIEAGGVSRPTTELTAGRTSPATQGSPTPPWENHLQRSTTERREVP